MATETRFDGHSPGPWRVGEEHEGRADIWSESEKCVLGSLNGRMFDLGVGVSALRISANLIAAAPDLLRVGQELADLIHRTCDPSHGGPNGCSRCDDEERILAAWNALVSK